MCGGIDIKAIFPRGSLLNIYAFLKGESCICLNSCRLKGLKGLKALERIKNYRIFANSLFIINVTWFLVNFLLQFDWRKVIIVVFHSKNVLLSKVMLQLASLILASAF